MTPQLNAVWTDSCGNEFRIVRHVYKKGGPAGGNCDLMNHNGMCRATDRCNSVSCTGGFAYVWNNK